MIHMNLFFTYKRQTTLIPHLGNPTQGRPQSWFSNLFNERGKVKWSNLEVRDNGVVTHQQLYRRIYWKGGWGQKVFHSTVGRDDTMRRKFYRGHWVHENTSGEEKLTPDLNELTQGEEKLTPERKFVLLCRLHNPHRDDYPPIFFWYRRYDSWQTDSVVSETTFGQRYDTPSDSS